MSGSLPFLTDDGFSDEPQAEPVAETQPEQQPEPETPKGEPEQAAPPAAVDEAKHIPISALLDERDKRKAAMAEAEILRRQLAEIQAKTAPKPDFYADPEAALSAAQQAAQEAAFTAALNTKLETSRFLAEKEFGAELVNEAYAFFDQNPHLSRDLIKSPSPFHEAVKTYQRQKMLQEIGDDPAAYRARIEAEARERFLAETQAQPKPTAPPPSMASAPGTAGAQQPPTSGFDALFMKG